MILTSEEFRAAPPASEEDIRAADVGFGFALPQDFREFLSRQDGGEGFVGEHYLILWKASELVRFNLEYEVDVYAPGLVIFASNGGGEGFAFDTRSRPFCVVQVPFIGMSHDHAVRVAGSFSELLRRMKDGHDALI